MEKTKSPFNAFIWTAFWALAILNAAPPAIAFFSTAEPLYFNDFSLLLYFNRAADAFMQLYGQMWGYDPHFMAGYPLTFIWQSNVAIQIFGAFLPGLDPADAIKLFSALTVGLAPFAFYASFRNFDFSKERSALGAIIAVTYFRTGLPMIFAFTGMSTACLATYLSILALSAYIRLLNKCDHASFIQLVFMAPLTFLAHKTSIVTFAIPAFIGTLIYWKKLNLTRIAAIGLAVFLTASVNSFWVAPMLRFMEHKVMLEWAPHWQNDDLLRPFKDYLTFSKLLSHKVFNPSGELRFVVILISVIRWLAAAFGIAGIIAWAKNGKRPQAMLFGLFAAFFFLFSYYGSFHSVLSVLNPTRYLATLNLLLCFPAAAALSAWIQHTSSTAKRIAGWAAILTLIAVNLGSLAVNIQYFAVSSENSFEKGGRKVVEWIKSNTNASMRVMIEDSGSDDQNGEPAKYGGSQLPALFPGWVQREFIGGPYPSVFLTFHQTDFSDGRFLGEKIESYDVEALQSRLNFYQVGWIIASTAPSLKVFRERPDLFVEYDDKLEPFSAFRYLGNTKTNRILSGKGQARADMSGIYLYQARPDKAGGVTLGYHYIKTLKTQPPTEIEPFFYDHDPAPYIRILNPPDNLRIYNSYSAQKLGSSF